MAGAPGILDRFGEFASGSPCKVIWQSTPFLPALLLTALACAGVGIYIWRYGKVSGMGPTVGSFSLPRAGISAMPWSCRADLSSGTAH